MVLWSHGHPPKRLRFLIIFLTEPLDWQRQPAWAANSHLQQRKHHSRGSQPVVQDPFGCPISLSTGVNEDHGKTQIFT